MARFKVAATGGTFDLLHKGHLELLRAAFSTSSFVIIGLVSDDFAARRGKTTVNNYAQRLANLSRFVHENFANAEFQTSSLDNDFGPAVFEERVQALIVSEETCFQGRVLNEIRARRNLPPVEVVTVPMALACDGRRISSTRLKNLEIDFDGNLTRSSSDFELHE